MMRRCLSWPLVALGLVFLLRGPAEATCGGGGGGGSGKGGSGQPYRTTWTKQSWEEAMRSAESRSHGLVLYFPPAPEEGGKTKSDSDKKDDGKTEHRFFSTKIPNDASKERLFYKAEGDTDAAKKLREEYRPKPDEHVILVCDWFGNPMKSFRVGNKEKVDGKQLESTLYGMDRLVPRLVKKLEAQADDAEKLVTAGNWKGAIDGLSELITYRGLKPAERGKALWTKVDEAGNAAVDEALRMEDAAARTKRLQELKKTFAGTKVEQRCKVELGEAPREEPAKPAGDAPAKPAAAEAWAEEFAGVDFATMPPSAKEQTETVLREGIALEDEARYDEAAKRYQIACTLDPKDSIPLVYLGEVYRHHMGDWDKAEAVMKRVVELDNDDFAMAIALHGLGKMRIWRGDDKGGLLLLEKSIARYPTALCFRNLAIYWTGDKTSRKGFEYAAKAFELDPSDGYNQVFYSIYLLLDGKADEAAQLFARVKFDVSMSYNVAVYYAAKGDRKRMLEYLKRHFFEYERYDAVRSFEMAEARMDALFAPWYGDEDFKNLTALARSTPWLGGH